MSEIDCDPHAIDGAMDQFFERLFTAVINASQ
jgi:hypothetical protein